MLQKQIEAALNKKPLDYRQLTEEMTTASYQSISQVVQVTSAPSYYNNTKFVVCCAGGKYKKMESHACRQSMRARVQTNSYKTQRNIDL